MAETIKAGFFYAKTEFDSGEAERLCKDRADTESTDTEPFEATSEQHTYRLTHATWNTQKNIFSGTMWLVRDERLPRKLTETGDEQLGLADNEDVGEPASFAYQPSKQRMLVEYNHTGPRHTAAREFIYAIGIDEVIHVNPMEKKDMLQRMKDADVIRKLEFALRGRDGIEQVRQTGESVGHAIDSMVNLDGYSIRVTISMGQHQGGLGNAVKELAERLANGGDIVKAVKVGAKQTEGQAPELLDLLNARLTTEIQVPITSRELNHDQCRSRLVNALFNQPN